MLRTTLTSLLCLLAAAGVQAQEDVYGGVFLTRTTISPDGRDDLNPIAIGAKLGLPINKNFAVEGRLGTGVSDDSFNGVGATTTVKINHFFGVYGKGIFPVSNTASLYGLIGYTQGKVDFETAGSTVSESDSDVSYGIGGEFAFSPTMSLNVEYARLFKGDNYKLDGLTLGLSFKF